MTSTSWILDSPESAAEVDEHFNGFHDGFVRSLTLRSADRFVAHGPSITEIGHETTGDLRVEMEIAHYNYDRGRQPHDRVVRARFEGVADVRLDLGSVRPEEWPIDWLEFSATAAGRLCALPTLGRREGGAWSSWTRELFTFARAELEEGRRGDSTA